MDSNHPHRSCRRIGQVGGSAHCADSHQRGALRSLAWRLTFELAAATRQGGFGAQNEMEAKPALPVDVRLNEELGVCEPGEERAEFGIGNLLI